MKRYLAFPFAALLIATGFIIARPAYPQSKDEQAIRTLEDRFAAALRAKDLDAMMKVYAPGDGIFVFDLITPREYASYDAYKKDWASLIDAVEGPIEYEVSELAIEADGNLAYSHSIQHLQFDRKDGSHYEVMARVTDVYRKIDGKWLIVHEHVSVPIDPATGKPDMMSEP